MHLAGGLRHNLRNQQSIELIVAVRFFPLPFLRTRNTFMGGRCCIVHSLPSRHKSEDGVHDKKKQVSFLRRYSCSLFLCDFYLAIVEVGVAHLPSGLSTPRSRSHGLPWWIAHAELNWSNTLLAQCCQPHRLHAIKEHEHAWKWSKEKDGIEIETLF